jgi:hypothetical protein
MAKLDKISLVWGTLFALIAQALLEGIFYTVQLRLNEAFAISLAMALVAGLLFCFLYRLGYFRDETKPLENPVLETKKNEDSILKLVQWIDEHEKQVIKPADIFYNFKTSFFLLIVAVFGVAEIMNFITATDTERISIGLASIAVVVAFLSIIIQTSETNLIEGHMKNANKLREFDDREKLLLKALIKIKSKNEDDKLTTLYEMDKETNGDIFTEKKLLESICK